LDCGYRSHIALTTLKINLANQWQNPLSKTVIVKGYHLAYIIEFGYRPAVEFVMMIAENGK
jgi:hypothetical protein